MRLGLYALAAITVWAMAFNGVPAKAEQPPQLILTTTPEQTLRVRVVNKQLPDVDPGHYVELANKAASECGSGVTFKLMPWVRALKSVKAGSVSAAFASSYKPDRAEYGAYPMKDGKPDEARAQRNYAYHLYSLKEDRAVKEGWETSISGERVGVEQSASIIGRLKELGAEVYGRTDYENLIKMVSKHRFRFAAGIADNFDPVLSTHPELSAKVIKLDPPLSKNVGYVMFGKEFYESNKELVECFWDQSAALNKSEWYQKLKADYQRKYSDLPE